MPKSLLEQLPEIVAQGRKHAERKLAVLLQRLEIRQFSDMALPAADGLRHVAEALRTA